jgi:hypothetical protein
MLAAAQQENAELRDKYVRGCGERAVTLIS